MYTVKKPYCLMALTPVHYGCGSDIGIVDLPIQRERHTGFPKFEASGIKGVIREYYRERQHFSKALLNLLFGPEGGDAHQSALGMVDARILFFPVKSVKGVFAWITCPACLAKFKESLDFAGEKMKDKDGEIDPVSPELGVNTIAQNCAIELTNGKGVKTVVLEEYPIEPVTKNELLTRLLKWFGDAFLGDPGLSFQKKRLVTHSVLVSDDVFSRFVRLSTEVTARTKIDRDTGTVAGKALWYEEYLPADSILYSTFLASRPMMDDAQVTKVDGDLKDNAEKVMEKLTESLPGILQIGGMQTVGKGFVKPLLLKEN